MLSPNHVITVGSRKIGAGQRIFLTAEIGLAHMGNFEDCKAMVRAAAEAGCDGVDIFMCSGEDFYFAPFGPGDSRDSRKTWREQSFNDAQWRELLALSRELDIILYPTPLDPVSLRRTGELGFPMLNLNSDDLNNVLMLEDAAKLGIPITFHDINASLAEAEAAVRVLGDAGARDLIILHSTQESGDEAELYASANLEVINTYRQAFGHAGVLAGCVEHTTSDFLIYAVTAMRPALISKHIQIDKEKNQHDNQISVNLAELKTMVKKVRYVEMALGGGVNQRNVGPDGSMSHGALARRKVLVAARDIPAGKVIERADLIAKRPGHLGGLHPWQAYTVLGARARHPIAYNTPLELDDFETFAPHSYKFPEIGVCRVGNVANIRGA